MPDGSSSAAPVTSPGPRLAKNPRARCCLGGTIVAAGFTPRYVSDGGLTGRLVWDATSLSRPSGDGFDGLLFQLTGLFSAIICFVLRVSPIGTDGCPKAMCGL